MNVVEEWQNAKSDLEKKAVLEKILRVFGSVDIADYFDTLIYRLARSE